MTDRVESRSRQRRNAVDRSVVLRKVMEVLATKGFARASMADLTIAAELGRDTLHKAFGTKDEILRAAIHFCADTEASLADEPLRASSTGREAILSMLEENVRLRRYWPRNCDCLFALNAFIVPPEDSGLQDFLSERRRSLSKQIRSRLMQSVGEGELPEGTNCEALANLCFAILSGLTVRIWEGVPAGVLFQSIEVFVNGLGFRPRRVKSRVTGSRRPHKKDSR
jgi:AcrR family transcriptional regulator